VIWEEVKMAFKRVSIFSVAILILLVAMLPSAVFSSEGGDGIIYVDADADGENNGTSWDDAYTDLQSALTEAPALAPAQIWVAAGTYTPTARIDPSDPRTGTFQMINNVGIYGGFDPSVGDDEWSERDWIDNETIVSGDIETPGNNTDNCYHVIYNSSGLDNTAIIDGFTITEGNANSGVSPDRSGGGVYNSYASPTLMNCTFSNNNASVGGGMHNWFSSPTLISCTFFDNGADIGGGMLNDEASPNIINCSFFMNTANVAGGINNWHSSPALTNCTFFNNSASVYGGGLYNEYSSAPNIINCFFWNNTATSTTAINQIHNSNSSGIPQIAHSDVEGSGGSDSWDITLGNDLGGNIDADPLFRKPDAGDLRLTKKSPCADAGNNYAVPEGITTDFEGDPGCALNKHVADTGSGTPPIVDMGADEWVQGSGR